MFCVSSGRCASCAWMDHVLSRVIREHAPYAGHKANQNEVEEEDEESQDALGDIADYRVLDVAVYHAVR